MNYQEITINGRKIKLIPLGDCACGCGGKTRISNENDASKKWVKGRALKFIRPHKSNAGRRISRNGRYFIIHATEHPKADKSGYVLEHIVIAEKILGKPLPLKAVIHHANGDGFDNTPSNLVICENPSYHSFIDQRRRAYEACGHPHWRKCNYCKKYDDPQNLHKIRGNSAHHKKCQSTCRDRREYKRNYNFQHRDRINMLKRAKYAANKSASKP